MLFRSLDSNSLEVSVSYGPMISKQFLSTVHVLPPKDKFNLYEARVTVASTSRARVTSTRGLGCIYGISQIYFQCSNIVLAYVKWACKCVLRTESLSRYRSHSLYVVHPSV